MRGLIVLVLVIGAGLGWMVRTVRDAQIQREAVAAIRNAGGRVTYDWEWTEQGDIPGGKPWAPRWLTDLVGVDASYVAFTLVRERSESSKASSSN